MQSKAASTSSARFLQLWTSWRGNCERETRGCLRSTRATRPFHSRAPPPPPPDEIPDAAAEVEASGLFDDVEVRRYVWEHSYTAEEYIALQNTFSGHIAMQEAKREHLYREIRRRIGQRHDGRVLRHWYAILHVARRANGDSR
jgi:hypothetical protein